MIPVGNHETLMDARGAYYGLVEAQNLRVKSDDQKEIGEEEITGMILLFSNLVTERMRCIIAFSTTCL